MRNMLMTGAALAMGALLALPEGASAQATQTLRLGTVVNAPHPWIDMAEYFKREVETRSDGALSVTIYPGGQLGNDQTMIDEMRIGTLDLIIGGTQNAAPFVPEYQIFGLSYLFRDMDHFRRAIDAEGELFRRFEDLHDQHGIGIRLLAFSGGGTRNLSNSVGPVSTVDDLSGLRMRVPGSPLEARLWSALGPTTTSLPWTELYSALQTGVVNTFESTISGYYGSKLYEVAPHHAQTQHQVMVTHFSIGEPGWGRLSEEHRELVRAVAHEAGELGTERGEYYDSTLLEELRTEYNVQITDVERAAFIELLEPLQDEFAEEIGASDLLALIRTL